MSGGGTTARSRIKGLRPAAFAALAVALCAPASAGADLDEGFLQFSASRTLLRNSHSVAVSVGLKLLPDGSGGWQNARNDDVWFHAVFDERLPGMPGRHRWTDGRACPAAVAQLRRVRTVAMPRPVLPIPDPERSEQEGDIYLDGRVYDLRLQSANLNGQAIGSVAMSSNVQTDLSRWVEAMLATLEPCWSRTAPDNLDPFRGTSGDAQANARRPAP